MLSPKKTKRTFGKRGMTHFLFDVDGTLTEARKRMSEDFSLFFLDWMKDKSVFLVSGSDLKKISLQIPVKISSKCEGSFCCMANELWIKNKLVFKSHWKPPEKLVRDLGVLREQSPYRIKRKKHIEMRTGMLNFSVAGRDSSPEERMLYNNWDNHAKEREQIASFIENFYPDLEACLGGDISIDIQPKGNNKSLASRWVRKKVGGDIVFFGDKISKGGNDWALAEDIKKNKDGEFHNVKDFLETQSILATIYK